MVGDEVQLTLKTSATNHKKDVLDYLRVRLF